MLTSLMWWSSSVSQCEESGDTRDSDDEPSDVNKASYPRRADARLILFCLSLATDTSQSFSLLTAP